MKLYEAVNNLADAVENFKAEWPQLLTFPRKPDFVIKNLGKAYLRRWFILPPRAKFGLNIYLHNILRSDDERALHDHPWWNVSIVLWGGYFEHMPGGVIKWRGPGSIIYRPANASHRLELKNRLVESDNDGEGNYGFHQEVKSTPCWSIFITGRWQRVWGFHCPKGWIPWRQFQGLKAGEEATGEEIGPGCGE